MFPWAVTLVSGLAALALFVHSTVPATRAHRRLEQIEHESLEQLRRLESYTAALESYRRALPRDPEHVLVELDRLDILAEDLGR